MPGPVEDSAHEKRRAQAAGGDRDEILELAKARIGDLVPDADLSAFAVAFTVIRAAERITYELETVYKPMGWSWPGFRVLFWVWLLGPLEPRQIATLASSSRASISSALNTLERNGFVQRSRGSVDRRLVRVELTKEGAERMVEAIAAANGRERELVAGFNADERRLLTGLLARLLIQGLDDQRS
jgi:DNA-binding MarR family transcriptional regulator